MSARLPPREVFGKDRPLVAVIHLPPLPGAPGNRDSLAAILKRVTEEAYVLGAARFDGLIVENYGDVPFFPGPVPPETVAAMALAVERAVHGSGGLAVGVNVLRNDAAAALAIAAVAGARFIRVNVHTGAMLTDQGWIEGRAADTLRSRARLGARVAVLADVLVKHAARPEGLTLADAARDAWHRGLADGLIVTGTATGEPVSGADLAAVRAAAPEAPLWIGSGLTPERAADLLAHADGAIVGSALREDGEAGRPLDGDRIHALVSAARTARAVESTEESG